MKRFRIAGGLLLACCAASAMSEPASEAAKEELKGSTCGQFLKAVEAASEGEGEAAATAQDELVITLFWVHGFVSGKTGTPPRLDGDWMAHTVARLSTICKGKAAISKPIGEAVKEL